VAVSAFIWGLKRNNKKDMGAVTKEKKSAKRRGQKRVENVSFHQKRGELAGACEPKCSSRVVKGSNWRGGTMTDEAVRLKNNRPKACIRALPSPNSQTEFPGRGGPTTDTTVK